MTGNRPKDRCTGDRCDDRTHKERDQCPYCLGSGSVPPKTDDVPPVPQKPAEKREGETGVEPTDLSEACKLLSRTMEKMKGRTTDDAEEAIAAAVWMREFASDFGSFQNASIVAIASLRQ